MGSVHGGLRRKDGWVLLVALCKGPFCVGLAGLSPSVLQHAARVESARRGLMPLLDAARMMGGMGGAPVLPCSWRNCGGCAPVVAHAAAVFSHVRRGGLQVGSPARATAVECADFGRRTRPRGARGPWGATRG